MPAMTDYRWPTYTPRNITLDSVVREGAPQGRGSFRVRDTDGKVYLDAIGGIGCLPLGHGHPKWLAAVNEQMSKLCGAAGTFWTQPQQELAAKLVQLSPLKDARVFFGNTGTEVTEAAVKVATRATKRDVIIAFERAFHGRTLASIALTGTAKYREPYVTVLGEDHKRFATMNVARATFNDLASVEAQFAKYPDRVAMVCLEPIQGEGGINPATREFLVGLRELCHRHGALLGLDEIQAGCGRTGDFAAWTTIVGDDPKLYPDIIWWAKALGGGYPIAACAARGDLAEHMTKGSHGSTFGGHPVACAASLATLAIMEEENLMASAAKQLPTLRSIAEADPAPQVREIRGVGAMIGIDLGDADLAGRVVSQLQQEGVLVTLSGGTAIRSLMAFHAGEPELRELWTALKRSLEKVG
jgi:acetylornithine/succinyldiaminopimelate/putrescine aminotransferase